MQHQAEIQRPFFDSIHYRFRRFWHLGVLVGATSILMTLGLAAAFTLPTMFTFVGLCFVSPILGFLTTCLASILIPKLTGENIFSDPNNQENRESKKTAILHLS